MAYSLLVMLFSAALAWMLDLYGRMPWGNVRPSKTDLKHVSTASPVTKLSLKYRTASRWGGIVGFWSIFISVWLFGSTMNFWGWLSLGLLGAVSVVAAVFSHWWLISCRTRRPKR